MFNPVVALLFTILITVNLYAQNNSEWSVENPFAPHKEINFTVSEGTWMNLDVSPDGEKIVFDLLGDIYIMPVTGGEAVCIAEGLPFEVHPRFSNDGKKILFTSDRGGGDNIWIMNKDGSDKQQITNEDFRLCNNAVWMPGDEYIVTKKHFTSTRSLGAGEIWMYHITGGTGIQLTKRKNDQMDVGEPVVSPDGKYVYFSEDMSPGSVFEYNKDPNSQIYIIRRVSLDNGKVENVVTGPGGAVRPQISPDGNLLSFVRRVRNKSVLFIHDLRTGEEYPVYDELDKDQQETWATFGVYPNYNWMPDNRHIIFWAKGKINKLNIETLELSEIPFIANVNQVIIDALMFPQQVSPEEFTSRMIRQTVTSPDGKKIVFNSLGYLWIKNLPDGKPTRLTAGTDFEYEPSFSADGKKIIYTTWNDSLMSSIRIFDIEKKSSVKKELEQGFYHTPRFSSDGSMIVFRKGTGNSILGQTHGKAPGLYILKLNEKKPVLINDDGSNPSFSSDDKSILFMSSHEGNKALKSIDIETRKIKILFTSKYATQIIPSPDNKWVAFTELFNSYIAAFPATGETLDLSSGMKSVPIFRVTRDAGSFLHWSPGSDQLNWSMGEEYFSRKVSDCFTWLPESPDSLLPPDTAGIKIDLVHKTDIPHGKIAFTNARIITMNADQVIENGTVVISGNRITAVGKTGEVSIPSDTKVMDINGKVIMPGLVDVHAHIGVSWNGITPQQHWPYLTNLAYGVTTTHDPSNNTEMVFSQSEMVLAGNLVGPRIFSTGTILYGAEGDFKAVINSLDDARSHLRRMKSVGAFSVKSYNQPRRNQRQQVIQAAHELEMLVYPEGGSFFYHNISMILDGHTGIEHSIPVSPVYNDVVQLWKNSKTGYTPTLIVGYGGNWGENYWYQKTDVWKNEKLLRFYPRGIIDSRSRRRTMVPEDEFGHIENARVCKLLLDAGVNVQLGAHGQLQGLGVHWELWMFVQGGMTNMEALRAATLMGAEYLGMSHEIGSIEVGKIADLIILEKDPLENIRNSESVKYTMINGRLYDAGSMNEIGNYNKPRKSFYWERNRYSEAFEWHEGTGSFMENSCTCFGRH